MRSYLPSKDFSALTPQLNIIYLGNVKVYAEGMKCFENGLSDANSFFKWSILIVVKKCLCIDDIKYLKPATIKWVSLRHFKFTQLKM